MITIAQFITKLKHLNLNPIKEVITFNPKKMKKPYLFDMETNDPDDFFTLCLLCTHPEVDLVAVTVTPGSDEQIGLVHQVLACAEHSPIPVGSYEPGVEKNCISKFHFDFLGKITPQKPNAQGFEIILETLKKHPDLTIVTGAPLRNFRQIPEDTPIKQMGSSGRLCRRQCSP